MSPASPASQPVDRPPLAPRRTEHSEAILAAANRLVQEVGEDFTTQQLIKEAGVALQTFYRTYGGKDQLLLAVISDLIAGHCRQLADAGRTFEDPVERLHFYITATAEAVAVADSASARFLTSQHWRLHQEYPSEVAVATRPYTDLVMSALAEGRVTGQLAPRNVERDAWLITKLVMGVFHHYAYVRDDPDALTIAEDLWQFCVAAVGGSPGSLD